METEQTSPAETPRINPAIAAELDNLTREAEGDTASQAEAKAEFDNSPEGRWKAAITDIAPMIGMIHPDLKPTAEEVPILADGLAPALAKHFPDMTGFTLPVEMIASLEAHHLYNTNLPDDFPQPRDLVTGILTGTAAALAIEGVEHALTFRRYL